MRWLLTLLAALGAPATAGAQLPPGVSNARVETLSAAPGLARTFEAQLAARSGPFWIGWTAPAVREQWSCCWGSDGVVSSGCGCRLEREGGVVGSGTASPVKLEGSERLLVLLRAEGGHVGRIRTFSEGCPIDAGGLALVWLEPVEPAQSVALLAGLVGQPANDARRGRRLGDEALAAIAFHRDASADAALERFVAALQPFELRKQAAFWLGQARGVRGYELLRRLVRDDADPRLREHAIFALSQSREPQAVDAIIEAARRDPDPNVRGQALFWLAQTAARRAPQAIRRALDDDPELEVKKKAVFALSQLPKDEGVPLLIGVARNHPSAEVRKQAMFWLGQSQDARALAFFADVLKR